jgi:hypothetical protein
MHDDQGGAPVHPERFHGAVIRLSITCRRSIPIACGIRAEEKRLIAETPGVYTTGRYADHRGAGGAIAQWKAANAASVSFRVSRRCAAMCLASGDHLLMTDGPRRRAICAQGAPAHGAKSFSIRSPASASPISAAQYARGIWNRRGRSFRAGRRRPKPRTGTARWR